MHLHIRHTLSLWALAFQILQAQHSPVIPTPQSHKQKGGTFRLSSQTHLIFGEGTTQEDNALADLLNRRLVILGHSPLVVSEERDHRTLIKGSVYVATPRSDFTEDALARRTPGLVLPPGEEAYLLDIRDDGIILIGRAHRGRFYGMMTLLSLLTIEGRSLQVHHCTVLDWPQQERRGFRLVVEEPPDILQEHLTRLAQRLTFFKLNNLVISSRGSEALRSAWEQAVHRISTNTMTHGLTVTLDPALRPSGTPSERPIRVGLLPPGPGVIASMETRLSREAGREGLLPIILDMPSLYSFQWLEFVAAWIAERTWNPANLDLADLTQRFFDSPGRGDVASLPSRAAFSLLQQIPLNLSWDELWIDPHPEKPCIHSLSRRYTLETLLAGCRNDPSDDAPMLTQAVRARVSLLEVIAAVSRAGELLMRDQGTPDIRRGAVLTVLRSLDRLEEALMNASSPPPFGTQAADLLAGISFQRRCWMGIGGTLEQHPELPSFQAQRWIAPAGTLIKSKPDTLSFRRTLELPASPVAAHLLVLGRYPGRLDINMRTVARGYDSPLERIDQHPPTTLYDVRELLQPGNNSLVLTFGKGSSPDWSFSAFLHVEFQNGEHLAVAPDTLWEVSSGPAESWQGVLLSTGSSCPWELFEP